MTLDEIARRNYSEGTTRAYLRVIEDFARYFHRPPKLRRDRQEGERSWHVHGAGEEAHCAGEAEASEPAQHITIM